jgi:hypothetical protein
MQANAMRAAKGLRGTPMPSDKGVQTPALRRPLQLSRRGMCAMVSHERLIASLGHDPFPIVTIQRQEVPVPNPILGKTMPESREGTPGEPTNSYGCPVLLQQMNRGGPIAKGIEGPREIFGKQRWHKSIGHCLSDQLAHALMAQLQLSARFSQRAMHAPGIIGDHHHGESVNPRGTSYSSHGNLLVWGETTRKKDDDVTEKATDHSAYRMRRQSTLGLTRNESRG